MTTRTRTSKKADSNSINFDDNDMMSSSKSEPKHNGDDFNLKIPPEEDMMIDGDAHDDLDQNSSWLQKVGNFIQDNKFTVAGLAIGSQLALATAIHLWNDEKEKPPFNTTTTNKR